MKRYWLLIALVLMAMCLSCADIVIGENPIVTVGDTIYVLPMEDDYVSMGYGRYHRDRITVTRYYEDGYNVDFEEDITYEINKVLVTLPNGHVYVLPIRRSRDRDNVIFDMEFIWPGHYDNY